MLPLYIDYDDDSAGLRLVGAILIECVHLLAEVIINEERNNDQIILEETLQLLSEKLLVMLVSEALCERRVEEEYLLGVKVGREGILGEVRVLQLVIAV